MTAVTPFQLESDTAAKRSSPRKRPFEINYKRRSTSEISPKRQLLNRLWPPMVVCLGLVLVLATGDPLLSLVLPVMILVGVGLVALPFDTVLPLSMVTMLIFNSAAALPHDGFRWSWPPDLIGKLLWKNLPLKFAPSDVILAVLLIRALITIRLSDVKTGGIERRPMRPYAQACMFSASAVIVYTVYGIGTGGSFSNMLWQVRSLLWFPLFALSAGVAAATPDGIKKIKAALTFAAIFKAIEALAFKFTFVYKVGDLQYMAGRVLRPKEPPIYATTHSDTVLWATVLCILIADWFETRTKKSRNRLLYIGIPLLAAMVINNRRTAYVAVVAGAAFIVSVAQRNVKKELKRLLGLLWPLLILYVGVGLASSSQSVVFKPVRMIESVVVQDDTSSDTRDIENGNLLFTMRARPLLGYGFGHPYTELVVALDVTASGFANYRYVPHNSFLGIWAFGGLFFPMFYMMPIVVAIYYGVNTRRRSGDPFIRSSAAWAVCSIIAYLIQGWSDIGMQDIVVILCAGSGMGICASIPRMLKTTEDSLTALEA
jgi:O-Antigen ligase